MTCNPLPLPEPEIIALAAMGEDDAFKLIYDANAALIRNRCRMFVDDATADDLVQQTFLQAHRNLSSFRGDSTISTWLYKVATNECLTYLRKHRLEAKSVVNYHDNGADVDVDTVVNKNTYSFAGAVEAKVSADRVLELVSPKIKPLFEMLLQGVSVREISRRTGRPLSTVEMQFRTAIQHIRKREQRLAAARGARP